MLAIRILIAIAFFISSSFPQTLHLFWYNAITNCYNLQDAAGPNLPSNILVHEGPIASGGIAQNTGSNGDAFVFGSGLDDLQGRCAWFWSHDLCGFTGKIISAKVRAEYRDGWSGRAFCNAGPIKIVRGVVDFAGSLPFDYGYGIPFDGSANWRDDANLIGSFMGYNTNDPEIKARDTILYTAPTGRQDSTSQSVLDGKFMELDCTPQVQWILNNTNIAGSYNGLSGQYAVVFLVAPNEGNIGKVNTYSSEAGIKYAPGSDLPWTQDGNTFHLLVQGDDRVCCGSAYKAYVGNSCENIDQGLNNPVLPCFLSQNTPNPFNPKTVINYNTGQLGGLIEIFSPRGERIFAKMVIGNGSIEWTATENASGIYVYRLSDAGKTIVKKMVLLR